jgi:3',5'-cyclic AMP phosphodiesterase CpdA
MSVHMVRLLTILTALLLLAAAPFRQTPAGRPFFFIQMSDPQFGFFTADKDFAQETANFEFAIASANRLRPAFVIVTGDLVNKPGDPAQIAEYQRIAGTLAPGIHLYNVAGNHDVGNTPTPASVAAYRARFGPDHYTFREGSLLGIVLDSSLIAAPDQAPAEADAQIAWLRTQLADAPASGARHLVIFQHHSWFLKTADEPDQYFNIPRARRDPLLAVFRAAGIHLLVSGHYHQNAEATAGDLMAITTGPVGKPLGQAKSGLRIFRVSDEQITQRYYDFGELPTSVALP